jgi:hypothetical protein
MDLNKFIHNAEGTPFHSSGYAESANGGSIGSTSSQTFGQRTHIERNRRAVRRYGDSLIGQNYMREATQTGTSASHSEQRPVMDVPSRQQFNIGTPGSGLAPPPRSSFREPPSRPFNPYS